MIKNIEIRSITVTEKTTWRHLLIHDGDGAVGVGEFTLDRGRPNIDAFVEGTVRKLLDDGAAGDRRNLYSVDNIGTLHEAAAVSALDQALNDLEAKRAGQPLWKWLAPQVNPVPVCLYANINRRCVERTPEDFRESAREAVTGGFDVVKIAPFDGLRPELCGTREGEWLIDQALERVAAVSDCLPENGAVQVDCHWKLSSAWACKLVRTLSDMKVTWFECPIPESPKVLDEIVRVRQAANACGVRLAGCEIMTGWRGFEPYIEAGCYDIIMPDVKYVGGFDQLEEIVQHASRRGVAVSLHNPSGPICHAHSLHAAIALQLRERMEVQFRETSAFGALTVPALSTAHPVIAPPESTGIGVVLLDESSMASEINSVGQARAPATLI